MTLSVERIAAERDSALQRAERSELELAQLKGSESNQACFKCNSFSFVPSKGPGAGFECRLCDALALLARIKEALPAERAREIANDLQEISCSSHQLEAKILRKFADALEGVKP